MKNLLAALVLILAAAAPARSWERLEGQHSGVKTALSVAVQDPRKWAEIWRLHDASAPLPEADFTKENIVVVFLGRKRTAGVKVELVVRQDPLDASRLNVFYREIAIKKNFAAQMECEPYAIVKVRRAAAIDVEKDGVVNIPEHDRAAARVRDERKMKALIQGLEVALKFD